MNTNLIECACGCKGMLEATDKRGRPRKFLPSHFSRVQPSQIETVPCEQCGKPLARSKYKRTRVKHQFCDLKCQGEWATATGQRRGENNGHYNTITVPCAGCGANVSKAASLIERRNGRVYCPDCFMPKKAERTTWADYPPEFSRALRRQIRERDGNACLICGALPTGKKAHQIHHIDYDKHNNDERNLATVCNRCHGFTHWARETWTAKLQAIMAERHPLP